MPNSNIRLIIERNIPFVSGLLDDYATVRYLSPEEITNRAVRDADGLIIRTRTHCDGSLLAKSDVKFIATATIGTDHIDADYCRSRHITAVNAPGCNAPAVAQYVMTSLLHVINRPLQSYTIAVIGLGHVGTIVARWAEAFGMKVLRYDPPRQEAEGGDGWATLADIAMQADIITFHTPLTTTGPYPTRHMADAGFFAALRRAPIIVNSARGAVVDTEALKDARRRGLVGPLIIDCWEGEPAIDTDLLAMADIATPHIAGYSIEGKIRASQMALDAITTFFMMPRVTIGAPLPPAPAKAVSKAALLDSYDPMADTEALRRDPAAFETLRNHYDLRHDTPESADPV